MSIDVRLMRLLIVLWTVFGCTDMGEPIVPSPPIGELPPGAKTVSLIPTKDNTLLEDQSGSLSNGSGIHLFVGRTNQGLLRRGIIAFNVLDSIPAGATIHAATLTLHLSKAPPSGLNPVTIFLHAVQGDWGEGASNATGEEGQGAPSSAGDATWIHAMFDTQLWSTPGGDYSTTPSSSRSVGGVGFYSWAGSQLESDVQSWLNNPSSNFGWILIGNEGVDLTGRRFDSRENPSPESRPRLVIQYSVVP